MSREGIIRTLAFQGAWGYAPTRLQLAMFYDQGSNVAQNGANGPGVDSELSQLIQDGLVFESDAHLALKPFADQIQKGREREIYFPRKLRRARQVASYLRRLPWVRAVCLCNTTALGQARDEGDLDFFVIAKAGAIWRTRFFATLPFKLLGARPSSVNVKQMADPVCLSFFVTDDALDLSGFMLHDDDPYFRYWFLSLLPLTDDGVMEDLWVKNQKIRQRHPLSKKWMALDSDDVLHPKNARKNKAIQPSWLESRLKSLQEKQFPEAIKSLINQDTRVMASNQILKFHVEDRREEYRQKYFDICKEYGVEP
jgi:hypothetical protein